MLEDVLSAVVRSQVGNLKRRTTGALVEAAGLGLLGLAAAFLFLGAYLWLSTRIEAWLAALLLALVALCGALAAMLAGRSLMRRRTDREHEDLAGLLRGVGILSTGQPGKEREGEGETPPGPGLVLAALAAGIALGRSLGR